MIVKRNSILFLEIAFGNDKCLVDLLSANNNNELWLM